jgi:hypothetical protein
MAIKVPNAEIREAFLRSGVNVNDIANFCGWLKKDGMPDTTKVSRMLGLTHYQSKKGTSVKNTHMHESNAYQIIRALNLDPVDFRDSGL